MGTLNAAGAFGGGISVRGGAVTGTNCTFSQNSAQAGPQSHAGAEGGAIYIDYLVLSCESFPTSLTLGHSTFTQNSLTDQNQNASTGGGAIYARRVTVSLDHSSLTQNSAPNGRGGALFWWDDERIRSVSMTDCVIHGNSAGEDGGAEIGRGAIAVLTRRPIS